jgi:dihydrofolate synthase/folylpolyglutamate synthase
VTGSTESHTSGPVYRRFLERLQSARTLGVSFGLDRINTALAKLGSPQNKWRAVQIAGTNGKGSTAAMAESILRAAGLRTGLFTSPHLARFTERIRIDGREVSGDRLAALDQAVAATGVPLTYFEISAVLAFVAFAEAGVDVAVLETGLGGRLDAASAGNPAACAITSIAFDHQDLLGHTLREIAYEKACIARPGVPLFAGPLPDEAAIEVERVAMDRGALLRRYGRDFFAPSVPLALAGPHQSANAAIAVALAETVSAHLGRRLPADAVTRGLAQARWPGRLERLASDLLLDCAHNEEGAGALAATLPSSSRRVLVISVVRGKDAAAILRTLAPLFDLVVATRSGNERALDPADVVAHVERTRDGSRNVECEPDPTRALARARQFASQASDGLTVVAGSIFLVGALRARLLGEPSDDVAGGDPLP